MPKKKIFAALDFDGSMVPHWEEFCHYPSIFRRLSRPLQDRIVASLVIKREKLRALVRQYALESYSTPFRKTFFDSLDETVFLQWALSVLKTHFETPPLFQNDLKGLKAFLQQHFSQDDDTSQFALVQGIVEECDFQESDVLGMVFQPIQQLKKALVAYFKEAFKKDDDRLAVRFSDIVLIDVLRHDKPIDKAIKECIGDNAKHKLLSTDDLEHALAGENTMYKNPIDNLKVRVDFENKHPYSKKALLSMGAMFKNLMQHYRRLFEFQPQQDDRLNHFLTTVMQSTDVDQHLATLIGTATGEELQRYLNVVPFVPALPDGEEAYTDFYQAYRAYFKLKNNTLTRHIMALKEQGDVVLVVGSNRQGGYKNIRQQEQSWEDINAFKIYKIAKEVWGVHLFKGLLSDVEQHPTRSYPNVPMVEMDQTLALLEKYGLYKKGAQSGLHIDGNDIRYSNRRSDFQLFDNYKALQDKRDKTRAEFSQCGALKKQWDKAKARHKKCFTETDFPDHGKTGLTYALSHFALLKKGDGRACEWHFLDDGRPILEEQKAFFGSQLGVKLLPRGMAFYVRQCVISVRTGETKTHTIDQSVLVCKGQGELRYDFPEQYHRLSDWLVASYGDTDLGVDQVRHSRSAVKLSAFFTSMRKRIHTICTEEGSQLLWSGLQKTFFRAPQAVLEYFMEIKLEETGARQVLYSFYQYVLERYNPNFEQFTPYDSGKHWLWGGRTNDETSVQVNFAILGTGGVSRLLKIPQSLAHDLRPVEAFFFPGERGVKAPLATRVLAQLCSALQKHATLCYHDQALAKANKTNYQKHYHLLLVRLTECVLDAQQKQLAPQKQLLL